MEKYTSKPGTCGYTMFATYLEVIGGRDVSFYMIFSQIQMF